MHVRGLVYTSLLGWQAGTSRQVPVQLGSPGTHPRLMTPYLGTEGACAFQAPLGVQRELTTYLYRYLANSSRYVESLGVCHLRQGGTATVPQYLVLPTCLPIVLSWCLWLACGCCC